MASAAKDDTPGAWVGRDFTHTACNDLFVFEGLLEPAILLLSSLWVIKAGADRQGIGCIWPLRLLFCDMLYYYTIQGALTFCLNHF